MDYMGKRPWWVIACIKVELHEQQCSLAQTKKILMFIDLGSDSKDSKVNVNIYGFNQLT